MQKALHKNDARWQHHGTAMQVSDFHGILWVAYPVCPAAQNVG
jgi:hypothetical protein